MTSTADRPAAPLGLAARVLAVLLTVVLVVVGVLAGALPAAATAPPIFATPTATAPTNTAAVEDSGGVLLVLVRDVRTSPAPSLTRARAVVGSAAGFPAAENVVGDFSSVLILVVGARGVVSADRVGSSGVRGPPIMVGGCVGANNPVNHPDPGGLCYQDYSTGNYVGLGCGGDPQSVTTENTNSAGQTAVSYDPNNGGGDETAVQAKDIKADPTGNFDFSNTPVIDWSKVGKAVLVGAVAVGSFAGCETLTAGFGTPLCAGAAGAAAGATGSALAGGSPGDVAVSAAQGLVQGSNGGDASIFGASAADTFDGLTTDGVDQLDARVAAIHAANPDEIAIKQRTTAVLGTQEGPRIIAGGKRDIGPSQRPALQSGEIEARNPNAHAEITALQGAEKAGLTPWAMSTSRPICTACLAAIQQSGGTVTDPFHAIWPSL